MFVSNDKFNMDIQEVVGCFSEKDYLRDNALRYMATTFSQRNTHFSFNFGILNALVQGAEGLVWAYAPENNDNALYIMVLINETLIEGYQENYDAETMYRVSKKKELILSEVTKDINDMMCGKKMPHRQQVYNLERQFDLEYKLIKSMYPVLNYMWLIIHNGENLYLWHKSWAHDELFFYTA